MRHNDEGILFIDLTQRKAFVGFILNENILFGSHSDNIKEHSTFLYTCLDKINKNILPLKRLKAIVVCTGYGSYTGIRVALSTVLGLAQVKGISIISVQSFEVLVSSIMSNNILLDNFSVALFARKNHFIYADYDVSQKRLLSTEQIVYNGEENIESLFSSKSFVFYDYEKEVMLKYFPLKIFYTTPYIGEAIFDIGLKKYNAKKFCSIKDLKPLYMQDVYITSPKKNYNPLSNSSN